VRPTRRFTSRPAEDRLRAAGLRVTAPRLAVLDALADGGHPRVDEVVAATRARLGSVSVQAVYDVLHALVAAGLAARFAPAGGPARFELRVGDHHHAVCRGCGEVTDVDGVAARGTVGEGFAVERAEVTYWGLCAGCRRG
jgi:Fur family transcriptional regulator, stress-responsive regulator